MLFTRFKHSFRLLLLLLSTLIIVSCGSGDGETIINESATGTAQLRLVFEDDFGGPVTAGRLAAKTAVSVDNWRPETGYGPNSDGWGNNEWQLYTDSSDNLYVENGSLVLEARCDTAPNCNSRDGTITSAKINTKDKLEVKYGVIQARIKVPDGQGMWPAFWMLGKNFPEQDWPDVGEIDIMEMLLQNSDNQTTHFSTHWAGPDDAPTSANCSGVRGAANPTTESENCFTSFKTLDEPLGNEFRVYEVDWDKDRIIGKVDGVTYFTQTIDPATMEEFQAKFYLLLSLAVGGNAAGAPDATTTWPQRMLVDWVRVFEKPQPTAGTLISETEKNIPFVRIYNSVEFGGNTAITSLTSTAVTPLEGTKVMEVNYAITKTGNPGATNALFGGPFFGFTRTDLSDFTTFRFSIDTSAYPGFDDMVIEFKDSSDRLVQVPLSDFTPTTNGNWSSYAIPLSAFAGVDITDMLFVGLLNPVNVDDELIAGTLYFDDIRFTTEACTAVGSVAFDSINYNPSTNVASVSVDDICAANSLATVKITAGLDEIVVGVDLDAAGQGETNFGLINPQSVCSSSDQLGYIALEAPFIATYTRSFINDGGVQQVNTATATAAIDENAPGTSIAGNKSYIYATSEPADFAIDNDFNLSDFSTGSSFDFNFTGDARFSPAFQVNQSANTIGVVAFFNFTAGFAASAETFIFKVKGVPNDFIKVEFGDPKTTFDIDLQNYSGSTDIGDGWFEVSIPMTEFPDVADNTFVQFTSDATSSTSFSYLITDIFLQDSASSVPAECETLIVPPVPGSGTGDTGATGGDFSVSFDDPAVTYGFTGFGDPDTITVLANDPEKPTNLVAQTTKPADAATFAGVTVEPVPGITYPLSATNNEMSIRIYAPGAGVTVRMKLENSANGGEFVEVDAVTTVDTGWETLTFTFTNPPAFTYDKLTLFFGFGEVGDGTVYTWDTIEFLGTVAPPPTGGELLTNGTFETGDTSGWEFDPSTNGTFVATTDQATGPGTFSGNLKASGAGSFPTIKQANLADGTVIPGQDVTFSFDLCGSLEGVGGVVFAQLFSEPEIGSTEPATFEFVTGGPLFPTDNWTPYTLTTVTGANVDGGVSVLFKTDCGGNADCVVNAYIDNVSLVLGNDTGNPSGAGGPCPADTGGGGGTAQSFANKVLYSSDTTAIPEDFVFGTDYTEITPFTSGSLIEEVTTDVDYPRALGVTSGFGYGGNVPQVAFIGFSAGFITAFESIEFKVKNPATNIIRFKAQPDGGNATIQIDLTTDVRSTSLGNDWYQVVIPVSEMGTVTGATEIIFEDNTAFGNGTAYQILLTDIGFNYFADEILYSSDTTAFPEDFVFGTDYTEITPFTSGSLIEEVTTDVDYPRALGVTSGFGYGGNVPQVAFIGFSAGFITAFESIEFKVKNSATNIIRFKAQPDGGNATIQIDLTTDARSTSLGNDWYQVVIPVSEMGTVTGATEIIFEDNTAFGNGTAYQILLTDIGFNYAAPVAPGGGGAGVEIAEDGSFESGNFNAWTQFESAAGNQTINTSVGGDTSSEGTRHLQINNVTTDTNSLIKQERKGLGTVTPGIAWTVTFDARGSFTPGGLAFAEFFCETAGGNEACGTGGGILGGTSLDLNPDPTVWKSFSFSGTAGSNTESLTLQLGATSGGGTANMFYDNISIIVGP